MFFGVFCFAFVFFAGFHTVFFQFTVVATKNGIQTQYVGLGGWHQKISQKKKWEKFFYANSQYVLSIFFFLKKTAKIWMKWEKKTVNMLFVNNWLLCGFVRFCVILCCCVLFCAVCVIVTLLWVYHCNISNIFCVN